MTRKLGFCERLARDEAGNALAIVTVGLFPILVAIGGGVDLTRAYMTQARMAETCDAAALAARKVMTTESGSDGDLNGDGLVPDDAGREEVANFVDYNFPAGTFGVGPLTVGSDVDNSGEMTVRMATTLPTTMMRIIGRDEIPISVDCHSKRSGSNVDVVLVLDTTGSMAWSTGGDADGSNERINALKSAGKKFTAIMEELQTQVASAGLRVRVAIIPYTQAVNIGKQLRAENSGYVLSTGTYYTLNRPIQRQTGWSYDRPVYRYTGGSYGYGNGKGQTLNLDDYISKGYESGAKSNPYAWQGCVEARPTLNTIVSPASDSGYTSVPSGAWDLTDTVPFVSSAPAYRPFFAIPDYGDLYKTIDVVESCSYNSRKKKWVCTTSEETRYYISPARYGPDTSSTKMDLGAHPWDQMNWHVNGNWRYVDEPEYTYGALTAYDVIYDDSGDATGVMTDGPNQGCPMEMQPFLEVTSGNRELLDDYIDRLPASGGTYHDVGMYWGWTYINSDAPFAQPETYSSAGDPQKVGRYIIFMTDGELSPTGSYSAYGRFPIENREGSGELIPYDQHRARFRYLCQAAKQDGISIATIAFGSTILGGSTAATADRTNLEKCATSGQYFEAADTGSLEDVFTKIGQNIGHLRVTR